MKNGFTAWLLIALSHTTLFPDARAKQAPLPKEASGEIVLPEQTDPQPQLMTESRPAVPATGSRGQLLYENHCQVCHTSIVHVRETHRARPLKGLDDWVMHWSDALKLPWSADEISDVVDYLNRRYYKIGLPSKSPQ